MKKSWTTIYRSKEDIVMTKDQKVEAYKMVLDGHSFQDIAKTFGTSRQQIYNLFGKGRRRKVNCI